MVKNYALLIFMFLQFLGLSQQWVDSIELARKSYEKKDYAHAEQIYTRQYKNAKKRGGLDEEIAQSNYRMRDFKKANQYYQRKCNAAKNKFERARLKHNIGNTWYKQGKYKEAIESYKESLRLNPNDEETRYNLSQALRQQQNKKKENNKNNPPPKKKPQSNPKEKKDKKQSKNQGNENKNQNQQNNSPSSGSLPKKDVEQIGRAHV